MAQPAKSTQEARGPHRSRTRSFYLPKLLEDRLLNEALSRNVRDANPRAWQVSTVAVDILLDHFGLPKVKI